MALYHNFKRNRQKMKIIVIRAIRGPGYYSQKPVIFMQLDLEDLEYKPTDEVPGFKNILEEMMPSLYEHTCSPGVPGGFFERVERGTWAGHVAEHIAIELQCLIGHNISFGKTFTLDDKGIYNVVFRYLNEAVGIKAGEMAVEITGKLFRGEKTDIGECIKELKKTDEATRLGPSTWAIVNEAQKRGIPWTRLNNASYIQFGQGKFQRRIEATLMDDTSALAVEIAKDKERAKEILKECGVPVPEGRSVINLTDALQVVSKIGYPVVVKPLDANHGRGVTTDIENDEELKTALEKALSISKKAIVEKFLVGSDFRILLIDGKFTTASLREPASVTGDGVKTIDMLIDETNADPIRGEGHEKNLTKIVKDSETERVLRLQNLGYDSVVPEGKKVQLKSTANLSSGGTAWDVTDMVHPVNIFLAERAAAEIGLNVMGMDIIAPDLANPLKWGEGGVVEVNAGPGFRMHLNPSHGKPRNIAEPVIDMLFPEGSEHSMPICAVTGTNGKTTTTRIIAHIMKEAGYTVGMTSTDAVEIDGVPVLKGDYSGPGGAQAVIRSKSCDMAVLEVARGGILRRGLGFNLCDVGVFLNVSSDHLGYGGIDTLEDLARVKSTVPESVKRNGYAVLNADDELVMARADKIKGNLILFSGDSENHYLKENIAKGNRNITVFEGNILLQEPSGNTFIAHVGEIPVTFGGTAGFNTENVMAAAGAALGLGISPEEIRKSLISFIPDTEQSSGRMNIIDMGDFTAVVDYGHNIGAIESTAEFIRNLGPGRLIRMAAGVGNRREEDIVHFGEVVAKYYDNIVLCDSSPRNRKPGETPMLVKKGLLMGGMTEDKITEILHEGEATLAALKMAMPGDVVVFQAENIKQVISDVMDFRKVCLKKVN